MTAASVQRALKPGGIASGAPGARAATFTATVAIGGPIAVLFALLALVGYLFFRSVALEHDATSRAADIAAMEQSLEAAVTAQEAMAVEYGLWDASFENTTVRWNPEFVRETFYSDLDDAHIILSADGQVRYGWSHPRHEMRGDGLVAAARAIVPKDLKRDDFLGSEPGTVTPRSYMGLVSGTPLVVSLIPIHPENPELLEQIAGPASVDFLVIARTLDITKLALMGRQVGLSDLRFLDQPEADEARTALAISTDGAEPVGYVSWLDRRPGTATFNQNIGRLLAGFALLSVLAALAIAHSVKNSLRASDTARLAAEAAMREAERANAAKSQFLATMSHELRTPLNAIIGYSEILAESAEDDRRQADARDAGRITAAGRHLLSMINQILDHAAIEAEAVSLDATAVNLAETADAVVAMLAPLARANGNQIELVSEGPATVALADPIRVKQCLVNVVGNAVKFTQSGTVRIACRRTRRDGRDWALLSVTDTGIGMSAETLAGLFTPFMQADGSNSRRFEGTGLGLAITKRLVEGMQGQIEVTSTPGAGTTVALRLPLYLDDAIAAAA